VPLYAGFDCSTQSLTVVVIDSDRRQVAYRHSVAFDTPFLPSEEPGVVHAAPRMWVAALKSVLGRLAGAVDVAALRVISGSAQQHGSVYCGDRPDILTRETAPIWMDSSTRQECQEIESALGGAKAVAFLTGSRAFPRFTGPQIRKFARHEPARYDRTVRIHLVSSYLASVLTGNHASIDHADGSGMNLMDIRRREWSSEALRATAPDLASKLPRLTPSTTLIGPLRTDLRERLSLPDIQIAAWSGDNPCSLVGTGLLEDGQLAISLGTSDTIFGPMSRPNVSPDGTGHVFASPLGAYMGITVFRNGSLARERVRDEFRMNWAEFSEALDKTPPGNEGAMMLPWFEPEITPNVQNSSEDYFGLEAASGAQHVRAIVEAQAMALARHSEWMGTAPRRIYATGGAAENRAILQVLADVFDAGVYRFDSTDSAALGAALRAYQAHTQLPWPQVVDGFIAPHPTLVSPVPAHVEVYRRLRPIYAAREAEALKSS
jgi:xylulokinase